jgi:transcriptional regulator with XRE-family HTH domain
MQVGGKREFALTARTADAYHCPMRLSEYLANHQLSPEQFALKVGVHATTIYRLLSGATIPKRQNLKKIIEATEGEVDISDLMFAVSPSKPNAKETAA